MIITKGLVIVIFKYFLEYFDFGLASEISLTNKKNSKLMNHTIHIQNFVRLSFFSFLGLNALSI